MNVEDGWGAAYDERTSILGENGIDTDATWGVWTRPMLGWTRVVL